MFDILEPDSIYHIFNLTFFQVIPKLLVTGLRAMTMWDFWNFSLKELAVDGAWI